MQKLPFVSYMPSINNKGTCQPFVLAHRASIGEFRVFTFTGCALWIYRVDEQIMWCSLQGVRLRAWWLSSGGHVGRWPCCDIISDSAAIRSMIGSTFSREFTTLYGQLALLWGSREFTASPGWVTDVSLWLWALVWASSAFSSSPVHLQPASM